MRQELKKYFRIIQLNVEGMLKAITEIIAQTFKVADIIVLQETHVPDDKTNRLKVNGFQLIHFSGYPKHGTAT